MDQKACGSEYWTLTKKTNETRETTGLRFVRAVAEQRTADRRCNEDVTEELGMTCQHNNEELSQ